MSYRHLSQDERYQIQALNRAGHSQAEIARAIARCKSTVSRELRRGRGGKGYRAGQAQCMALARAQGSRNARRIEPRVWLEVETKLRAQQSPEQIAAQIDASHESIYQYVYQDKATGGTLWQQLRCQKKRRKRYASGPNRRGQIPNRRDIGERPAYVQNRCRVGHWELDTIIGVNHKQAIVTVVERKSRFVLMRKVPCKSAPIVHDAIVELLSPFEPRVLTLTCDNGSEFAMHASFDAALGCTTYFAQPYCSWQRGTNENTNGLIRQYIPKHRPLDSVTHEEIAFIQHRLNTRPRKCLNFKSPQLVFNNSLRLVALRA